MFLFELPFPKIFIILKENNRRARGEIPYVRMIHKIVILARIFGVWF